MWTDFVEMNSNNIRKERPIIGMGVVASLDTDVDC